MHEATTVAAWAAWLSAATLALLGVDYYALLGAFGGVLATLSSVKPAGRAQVFILVTVNTFAAAIAGQGLANVVGMSTKQVVMLACLVCGAGLHVILEAWVAGLVEKGRAIFGGAK